MKVEALREVPHLVCKIPLNDFNDTKQKAQLHFIAFRGVLKRCFIWAVLIADWRQFIHFPIPLMEYRWFSEPTKLILKDQVIYATLRVTSLRRDNVCDGSNDFAIAIGEKCRIVIFVGGNTVVIGAVNKQDVIGSLLNFTGISKITQHRLLIRSRFIPPIELG